MAQQNLSTQAAEGNTPTTATGSYTSKDGRRIDLDGLRLALEIIADDIDMVEAMTRDEGDIELAEAQNAIFYDVDGLIPVTETAEGVRHE